MADLCTLANVKAFLGITSSATDGVLSSLITAISAAIESYCNRTFASAAYTESRNGTGGNRLFLAHGLVTAVASVTVDGQAIPAAVGTGTGYLFDETTVYLRGYCFHRGVQNVTVSYTAGYASVPSDVAQACVELVAAHFAKRDRIDKSSETLGTQQTISYSQADMPAAVKTALKQRVWWTVP
ncbi:head-tail connector protein [Frateuria terrea]|uniref:Phage gp6-like head-tail connector protein n=1 Tax=Frateuria terrea TaxID=529704 RepID=A0A1H7A279_9GAMM|nr:head-tail connector protein [Frateuria terrea]SEJ55960.1 phage conserved hypothetical protein, phiE125 gp8 family [Frateuria terrea]SFP46847.1 phage conserved hypothetical protein, phiE125 gp8 family [Frateuria terrea]